MLSQQPNPAITTMNKAAVRLFPPATIDLVTFLWSSGGKEHRHAPLAMKALGLAARSGHKSAMLWRCALYRSGRFGFGRRLVGLALTPIAVSKLLISSFFLRPFSAQAFSFPTRLKRPLLASEAKFSLYNELQETPELDRRRTLHRYLLAFVHIGVAIAAVLAGFVYRRSGAGSPSAFLVAVLLIPYLASATYSIRVVSYQRIRLFLFVLLLIGGATLTSVFIADNLGDLDPITAFIDIFGFQCLAFMWGAEPPPHTHTTMSDKWQFREYYGRLADDELARIALLDHLVPEAQETLTDELQKRGLTDPSEYKRTLAESAAASSVGNSSRPMLKRWRNTI
jgi:hypothetical protein